MQRGWESGCEQFPCERKWLSRSGRATVLRESGHLYTRPCLHMTKKIKNKIKLLIEKVRTMQARVHFNKKIRVEQGLKTTSWSSFQWFCKSFFESYRCYSYSRLSCQSAPARVKSVQLNLFIFSLSLDDLAPFRFNYWHSSANPQRSRQSCHFVDCFLATLLPDSDYRISNFIRFHLDSRRRDFQRQFNLHGII